MKSMLYVLLVVGFPLVFVTHTHAYIDPGTGSMIVQALFAAIAACAVTIGIFWHRLKDFWARLFGRNKDK